MAFSSVARFTSATSSRPYAKVSSTTSGSHARNSGAKRGSSKRSPWMCNTDGGSAAVVLPRWKTRTACPFSTSARTIHCPINPVPPIINTRIALSVLYVRFRSFYQFQHDPHSPKPVLSSNEWDRRHSAFRLPLLFVIRHSPFAIFGCAFPRATLANARCC